jgi:hypothetical protein
MRRIVAALLLALLAFPAFAGQKVGPGRIEGDLEPGDGIRLLVNLKPNEFTHVEVHSDRAHALVAAVFNVQNEVIASDKSGKRDISLDWKPVGADTVFVVFIGNAGDSTAHVVSTIN